MHVDGEMGKKIVGLSQFRMRGFLQSVRHVWFHFATTIDMPSSNYI